MTEREFLQLVAQIRPVPWIDPRSGVPALSFEESPFDSLDLLEIRAALETRLGIPLTDEKFMASTTLRDLYRLVRHA